MGSVGQSGLSKTKRLREACQQGWYWFEEGARDVYVAMTDWRPVVLDYTSVWVGLMLGVCALATQVMLEHAGITGVLLGLCSLASIKVMLGCSAQQYVRLRGDLLARANALSCAKHAADYLQQRSQDPINSEWHVLSQALRDLEVQNRRSLQDLEGQRQVVLFQIQVWLYKKYQTLTQWSRK